MVLVEMLQHSMEGINRHNMGTTEGDHYSHMWQICDQLCCTCMGTSN